MALIMVAGMAMMVAVGGSGYTVSSTFLRKSCTANTSSLVVVTVHHVGTIRARHVTAQTSGNRSPNANQDIILPTLSPSR